MPRRHPHLNRESLAVGRCRRHGEDYRRRFAFLREFSGFSLRARRSKAFAAEVAEKGRRDRGENRFIAILSGARLQSFLAILASALRRNDRRPQRSPTSLAREMPERWLQVSRADQTDRGRRLRTTWASRSFGEIQNHRLDRRLR